VGLDHRRCCGNRISQTESLGKHPKKTTSEKRSNGQKQRRRVGERAEDNRPFPRKLQKHIYEKTVEIHSFLVYNEAREEVNP
jgi:hypothetical protein